jgi:hypothetical protein
VTRESFLLNASVLHTALMRLLPHLIIIYRYIY